MIELRRFEHLQALADFNQIEEPKNFFIYYTLNHAFDKIAEGVLNLEDGYTLIDEKGNSILMVWLTSNLFFYSFKFTDALLDRLIEEIDIGRYGHHEITGQTDLVMGLIERSGKKIEVKKNRLVYECTATLPHPNFRHLVREPTPADLNELAEMSWAWYNEEYHGQGRTTKAETFQKVAMGIHVGGYFLLEENGVIISMVVLINDDDNFAMIGNFYTKPEFRNRGFGYALLYSVTETLLNAGFAKCGLISDLAVPESNRVFEKVGYVPVYKSTWAYKELVG